MLALTLPASEKGRRTTTATESSGARPVYDVPFLDSFTVDGDATEWGDGGLRVSLAGVSRDEQKLVPKDDIDVSMRLGWTDEGLAALLEVHDDEYVEDPFDHRLWTAASPPFEQTGVASVNYADLRLARYRVGCRKGDAGKTVSVLSRGTILAQATARADGDSAVAHLEGAYPPVGAEDEVQEIRIGEHIGATAFVRTWSGRRIAAIMRKPAFARHVFSEATFPPCEIGGARDVREWLGECTVNVQHYDAKYRPVDKAAGLGRYGAVVTVTPSQGEAFRLYRTLWRTDGDAAPGESDPLADARWWADLKTTVGLPDEAILDGLAEWDAVMSRHDFMPWGGEKGDHLIEVTTRENREALAKGVLEAKAHHSQAIEHIEKAIEAEAGTL